MKEVQRVVNGYKVHSWRPQLPDHRDRQFRPGFMAYSTLPSRVDPLAKSTRIHDQGMTNSCVGHAVTTAIEHAMKLPPGDTGQLSRMMCYYHARNYIGETHLDEGCYIRDAFKGVINYGVSPETNWRFTQANLTKHPTITALRHAGLMKDRIRDAGISYEVPKTLSDIKAALSFGQVVVFGFVVYDFIFSMPSDFILRMPGSGDIPIGGHAVLADGYDDASGTLSVQNSWGRSWGKDGYFFMPYEWFTDPNYLTGDFWTCRRTNQT